MRAARKGIDKKTLREVLHGLSHDTSPGLGGERNEHLTVLLFNEQREVTSRAQSAFDNMFEFVNDVVQVNLPGYFYRAWVANRLVPAKKVHPSELPEGAEPDCRPIKIGRSDRRLFSRAYWDESLQFEYNRILGPVQNQNGVGIKGGISITAMGVQDALDANPEFGCIQGDIKNGYNEVCRESIMSALKSHSCLSSTVVFIQTILEPKGYIGMGHGTELTEAPFRCEEGVHQGAVESGWCVTAGLVVLLIKAIKNV